MTIADRSIAAVALDSKSVGDMGLSNIVSSFSAIVFQIISTVVLVDVSNVIGGDGSIHKKKKAMFLKVIKVNIGLFLPISLAFICFIDSFVEYFAPGFVGGVFGAKVSAAFLFTGGYISNLVFVMLSGFQLFGIICQCCALVLMWVLGSWAVSKGMVLMV